MKKKDFLSARFGVELDETLLEKIKDYGRRAEVIRMFVLKFLEDLEAGKSPELRQYKPKKTITITINLTKKDAEFLHVYAKRVGASKSTLIRNIIYTYTKKIEES